MHDVFLSPTIIPLGAFAVAIVAIAFGAWKKVREQELLHEANRREKEMAHQLKLKEMDLELARLKEGKAE